MASATTDFATPKSSSLTHHRQGLPAREQATRFEQLGQVLPVQQLHHEKCHASVEAPVVGDGEVDARDAAREHCFALEAGNGTRIG
jgi:hypothetical protein